MTTTEMIACESSAFSHHAYDPAGQTLFLTFKSSGKTYAFPEVSIDIANSRLVPGTSLGRWYSDNIKGKFIGTPFEQPKVDIDEAAPE